MIDQFVYAGTPGENAQATDLAVVDGVRFHADCDQAAGNTPMQSTLSFYNAVNGGPIIESLLTTGPTGVSPVDTHNGQVSSGDGFNPGPGEQVLGIHGFVFAQGAAGAVKVDLVTFVNREPIFGVLACQYVGVLTPTY